MARRNRVRRLFGCALVTAVTAWTPRSAPAAPADLTQFHQLWNWTVTGAQIGEGALEIADLNGDGREETFTSAVAWNQGEESYAYELAWDDSFVQRWSSFPMVGGVSALALLLDDLEPRLVLAGGEVIQVFDGRSRELLLEFPGPPGGASALVVGDVDGDSLAEAVVCGGSALYVYDLETGAIEATRPGFGCSDLALGQIDADPEPEIALAGNLSGGFVLDGVALTVDWADVRGFGDRVFLEDFSGDGLDDVMSMISHDGGLRLQNPATGATLWEIPEADAPVGDFVVGEADPSAGREVVWTGAYYSALHVLSGTDGSELWNVPSVAMNTTRLAVGDPDGDGVPEVAWGLNRWQDEDDAIVLVDTAARAIEGATPVRVGPVEGFAVGDISGSGRGEVVAVAHVPTRDETAAVPTVFDAGSGRVLRSGLLVGSQAGYWFRVNGVTAGQIDGDAPLEICFGMDEGIGVRIVCLDGSSFEEAWRVAVPSRVENLQFTQLDGDPLPELLVGVDDPYVYAFEGESGWLKWRTPELASVWNSFDRIRVADFDGDGVDEIAAGYAISWQSGSDLTCFDPVDGSLIAGPFEDVGFISMALRPREPGPGIELLVGLPDGEVHAVDPFTGQTGVPVAVFPDPVEALEIADVDRDGIADLVAAGGGRLRVHSGASGTIVWTSPYLGAGAGAGEKLRVGDFDGNSVPEIVVGNGAGVAVFGAPLFELFSDGLETGDTTAWSAAIP